ncbi:RHS repeat domain-containing protein, partial [Lachnospiraceae bacterium HCP1S3_C3]
HYNNIGSTMYLTDSEGNICAEYIYGTYGELLKGDTNLTSYLYNGKYGVMTDENGLYYMRHRYYNTDIRRFVNQDIVNGNLGNSQSLNRYSYVQGNPLTYTDPFGLSPEKDGGSIGMNIVHGLLDALGCVPGGVGIVANFANAALYAVVDHDYGMAALSLVAGVTLGASKIVSMGGKLAGHAKSIETIGRLVSNTASFAICAEQTVSSSAAMWNKYHEKGAKLSGETALEILGIGLNVAGMAASGKGIVESGNRLGKMVKEGGTTNKMSKGISESGTSSVAKPNQGQGFSSKGYNPQPGERTFEGYVKQTSDPEISLYTKSSGFNNNPKGTGGQFKRFGANEHYGLAPHVHQPVRNVTPNGMIFGKTGKDVGIDVFSPNKKDIKQLYEYLNNGKYHE